MGLLVHRRFNFNFFPLELVFHVLCYLDPRDVVQLRLVSKLFRRMSQDPVIWRTIYANARVPRPPGPLRSQRFLEQTLIRSERVEECWTTQPIQAISSKQIQLGGSALGGPRIIGGRFLLTFESYRRIVFYDIETQFRQVLLEDIGLVGSWNVCSVASANGLLVYVVFRKTDLPVGGTTWKLLEFRVHDETGKPSQPVSQDVPSCEGHLGDSVYLVSSKSPFLYLTGRHLVFDTRSGTFYKFPEFGSQLDEGEASQVLTTHRRILLANTHILVVSSRLQEPLVSSAPESTLVQAFVVPAGPPPDSDPIGALRLSHEAIVPDRLVNLVLLRNSIIDTTTGSTSLRLLQSDPEDRIYFSCVDLMLPRPLSGAVLPLTIQVDRFFAIENGIYDSAMSPIGCHMEASNDGHARGFCRSRTEHSNRDWVTKFTIDASGDKCIAVVGEAALPRWIHDKEPPYFSSLSLDGAIGRCCYLESGSNWYLHGFLDVAVVDFK